MSETKLNYTLEQIEEIKKAFRENDITEGFPLKPEYDFTPEQAWIFIKIKNTFKRYGYDIFKKFGINRPMNNFSDDHPVNLLLNTDGDIIAFLITYLFMFLEEICKSVDINDINEIEKTEDLGAFQDLNDVLDEFEKDKSEVSDFTYDDLMKLFDAFQKIIDALQELINEIPKEDDESDDHFREIIPTLFNEYRKVIDLGLHKYAQSKSKNVQDINGEEIIFVLDKVFDVINDEQITVVMCGQQVPELYDLAHTEPAAEDYPDSFTFDKVNFDEKWYHSKTKIGAFLSLDELREDESFDIADNDNDDAEYKLLRDTFLDSLTDSTDYEIFVLREDGMTEKEIAEKLSYKTHKPVSKRLKNLKEQFYEFTDMVEESYKS